MFIVACQRFVFWNPIKNTHTWRLFSTVSGSLQHKNNSIGHLCFGLYRKAATLRTRCRQVGRLFCVILLYSGFTLAEHPFSDRYYMLTCCKRRDYEPALLQRQAPFSAMGTPRLTGNPTNMTTGYLCNARSCTKKASAEGCQIQPGGLFGYETVSAGRDVFLLFLLYQTSTQRPLPHALLPERFDSTGRAWF